MQMEGYENLYWIGMMAGMRNLYVVRPALAKFGLHAVSVKFHTKNE
jgi:hypothetical protein